MIKIRIDRANIKFEKASMLKEWFELEHTASCNNNANTPKAVVMTLTHEQRMERGSDYEDYGLVFATETGTPLLWRTLSRRHLKPLLTAVGIPSDGFSLYSLVIRIVLCA